MTAFQRNLSISENEGYLKSLVTFAEALEEKLNSVLPIPRTRLQEAMRYSVLGSGKRLRPYLTWASSQLFSVDPDDVLKVGVAIELIHAYSLVHDDLPCMDNADTRRGKPSCHKAFGEATAVLVGDALIPLAFQTLASLQASHEVKIDLINRLGHVSGCEGIVAGQMMDLKQEDISLTLETLINLQSLKTAVLFEFSVEAGAILGKAQLEEREALKSYGLLFGQAFQMIDDLLDFWGHEDILGKPCQQDQEKLTYLSFLTPSELYEKITATLQEAFDHLSPFHEKADLLKGAAVYVLDQFEKISKEKA